MATDNQHVTFWLDTYLNFSNDGFQLVANRLIIVNKLPQGPSNIAAIFFTICPERCWRQAGVLFEKFAESRHL